MIQSSQEDILMITHWRGSKTKVFIDGPVTGLIRISMSEIGACGSSYPFFNPTTYITLCRYYFQTEEQKTKFMMEYL